MEDGKGHSIALSIWKLGNHRIRESQIGMGIDVIELWESGTGAVFFELNLSFQHLGISFFLLSSHAPKQRPPQALHRRCMGA